MASGPITSWQMDGETVETVADFIWGGPKITADGDCSHEIKRRLLLGRKVMTNLDSILKSRDITLPKKVHLVKAMVFPVVMYGCELDYKESWAQKNWCFWTVVLEKILESPLHCKEIQPVHPKGDQSWVFIGRTDAEAELQYFGYLIWRTDSFEETNAGKDWRQEEKGMTDGWMASLTQWTWICVNFGSWCRKGGLACCSPWGRKESNTTEWLNWTENVQNRKIYRQYITGF